MALRPTNRYLAYVIAGTAQTPTRLSLGTGHRTPDGTETALVAPFNPAREQFNPPGVIDENTRVVDWIDGATGDTVNYTPSEAGLWMVPAGEAEYLAFYDSDLVNDLFVKTAGSIISHRFLIAATYAQLANVTFNVPAVPQATTTVAGVVELADAAEEAAGTAENRVPTVAGVRRMVVAAGIAIRDALQALTGNARLHIQYIQGDIDISRVSGLAAALASTASSSAIATLTNRLNALVAESARHFLVTTGNAFPTNPAIGAYHLFLEAVTSGLTWRDTNGATPLTSASAGDLARWTGSFWVRQTKRAGDIFMEAE